MRKCLSILTLQSGSDCAERDPMNAPIFSTEHVRGCSCPQCLEESEAQAEVERLRGGTSSVCLPCGEEILVGGIHICRTSPERHCLSRQFWSQATKSDGCWLWRGRRARGRHDRGSLTYGKFPFRANLVGAHRMAWLLAYGCMPPRSLFVCHRCDVTLCVRPEHLFLGTATDNMRDASIKGRLPHGCLAPNAKLTEDVVAEIKRRHHSGERLKALATEAGVSYQCLQAILSRRTWGHVLGPTDATNWRRNRGPSHRSAKLTPERVALIRERVSRGESICAVGREFSVSYQSIQKIRDGRAWCQAK